MAVRHAALRVPMLNLVCAALLCFFAVQGAIPGIAPSQALESTNAAPTPLMRAGGILSQLFVDGTVLFLVFRNTNLLLRRRRAMQYAAWLMLLAVLSTAWSLDPLLTVRRSLPFALAGLFGLWFAARFSLRRQLSILLLAMVVLAFGAIVAATCFPAFGLDHSPGHHSDWQGIFTQKNACGRIMVLASAVVLSARRLTTSLWAALLLFVFVLIMSGSRGAWLIEAVIFALFFLLRLMRGMEQRSRVFLTFVAASIAAGIAGSGVIFLPLLTGLMGRDATLSGRTAIWAQVWSFILKRPLQGYGYGAFWQGIHGESFKVVAAVHFIVFHAHNGFLEIWLELGAVGLLLFLLSYMRAWQRLWPALRRGEIDRIAWPLFLLVLIGLYDIDENTLLIFNGLFWVLYVSAMANIELMASERRVKAAALLRNEIADAQRPALSC